VGFISKLLGLEPNLIKLVSARILTDENNRYFVSISKEHTELKLPDLVRLALHFYAKILYNFDPANREEHKATLILQSMVQTLVDKGIRNDSQILKDVEIDDVVKIVSAAPINMPREIVATLYFVDVENRHITTDISNNIYVQQLVFAVPVLIQTILTELDPFCIDILNRSLYHMNRAYSEGASYSDMKYLSFIPSGAYMLAISGE
jgi:hypothetical protein